MHVSFISNFLKFISCLRKCAVALSSAGISLLPSALHQQFSLNYERLRVAMKQEFLNAYIKIKLLFCSPCVCLLVDILKRSSSW